MEKKDFSADAPRSAPRLSMAEEQRLAFEQDQRRQKRASSWRLPGFLFRN
jgi:hypothetical protein